VEDSALTCAAVLIPLLYKDGEWHVLVTLRTETVGHHRGQISFPGGACEPQDANSLETALRETFEEIGIPPKTIEVLGALDDSPTVTSFVVTPYVGVIPSPFRYQLNRLEVAAAIEVPLSFLRNPENLHREQREHAGRIHDLPFWDFGSYKIWGATARILKTFLELTSGDQSAENWLSTPVTARREEPTG
jgi:8-oxo-dGTP pyrophosphatase MutT (NUDIX family)